MLRAASTDSLCAMKPSCLRMKTVFSLPANCFLLNYRRASANVHFGAPFGDDHEVPVSFEGLDHRLILVGHFFIKLGFTVAGGLGQEIARRGGGEVDVFRGLPPLHSATPGWPDLRFGVRCSLRLSWPWLRGRPR